MNMSIHNKLIYTFSLLTLCLLLNACGLDNYDSPSSMLTGTVVYNGSPVGVASGEVEIELWEAGFDQQEKIPVNVSPKGTFSALLFDGDYRLTLLPGSGPWVPSTDTVYVEVAGNTSVDITVEPYYLIQNESYNYSNGSVSAEFTIQEVHSEKTVEYAGLYIGTTSIVDEQNNNVSTTLTMDSGGSQPEQSLSVSLPEELQNREFVFARLGLKIDGVSNLVFTKTMEISL